MAMETQEEKTRQFEEGQPKKHKGPTFLGRSRLVRFSKVKVRQRFILWTPEGPPYMEFIKLLPISWRDGSSIKEANCVSIGEANCFSRSGSEGKLEQLADFQIVYIEM